MSDSMAKAQRIYDNQTPWDNDPPEIPDNILDEFEQSELWQEYIEENCGGEDRVLFSERNFDLMYEWCAEWLAEQEEDYNE